jgi:hypothetical protein
MSGFSAIDQIFRVINEQSQGSFDENFNFISYYNWTGGNGALSPMVDNGGNGEPKAYTGMVSSFLRILPRPISFANHRLGLITARPMILVFLVATFILYSDCKTDNPLQLSSHQPMRCLVLS